MVWQIFARVALCAALLSALATAVPAGDTETDKALKAIRDAGGRVQGPLNGPDAGKLTALHISYATKDVPAVVSQIKYLGTIETVSYIGNYEITNEILKRFIEDLPRLKNLKISSPLTDEGLKIIARGKEIEILHIGGRKMTDAGLKHLASLPNLRELNVAAAQFTSEGFKELARLENLESISYVFLSDESLKGVGRIKNLKKIDLKNYSAHFKDAHWKSMEPLTNYKDVKAGVTDEGVKELAGLTNLRSLDFCQRPISDEGVRHLAALQNLEYLDLSGTKITDGALQTVGWLKKLSRISLDRTGVGDPGIAALAALPNLRTLDLCHTKVTDFGILPLTQMKELRFVSVGGTAVTADGKDKFVRLNSRVVFLEIARPPNANDTDAGKVKKK